MAKTWWCPNPKPSRHPLSHGKVLHVTPHGTWRVTVTCGECGIVADVSKHGTRVHVESPKVSARRFRP